MAITEQQLEVWSKLGPTAQFTATYEILRNALNDNTSPYFGRDFSIFLQGSYKNNTNVYGDSDVDVVIRLDETYFTDLSQLSEGATARYRAVRTDASYTLEQFKSEVFAWLTTKYGADVQPGTKAIRVKGRGSRRDADVLVCAQLRRYKSFVGWDNQSYDEGIAFFNSSGQRIDNFPKQHTENCTTKQQDTKLWFKPTVRIFKNLRNAMIRRRTILADLAPSYFIEGLLWNVPTACFGGTEQQNFADTLDWLWNADRGKFTCANGIYYLCHPNSLVTWRAEKCQLFLSKAIDFWNES